jgi:hypothetical protein
MTSGHHTESGGELVEIYENRLIYKIQTSAIFSKSYQILKPCTVHMVQTNMYIALRECATGSLLQPPVAVAPHLRLITPDLLYVQQWSTPPAAPNLNSETVVCHRALPLPSPSSPVSLPHKSDSLDKTNPKGEGRAEDFPLQNHRLLDSSVESKVRLFLQTDIQIDELQMVLSRPKKVIVFLNDSWRCPTPRAACFASAFP